MSTRLASSALALVLAGLALCSSAAAASSPWMQITGNSNYSATAIDQIGLERTADGVLHVLWTGTAVDGTDSLIHSSLAANGKKLAGPSHVVLTASGGGLNRNVDLVPGPSGGLRALFSGIFPGQPTDSVLDTMTAPSAPTTAASWSAPAALSNANFTTSVYVASGIGGAVSPNGGVIGTWGDAAPGTGGYHVGTNANSPDVLFGSTSCCFLNPNAAVDSSDGTRMVGYLSDLSKRVIQVRKIDTGTVLSAPGSGAAELQARVAMTGRIGGPGVYVAYGSGSNPNSAKPAWWRVGDKKATVLPRPNARLTSIAPAPGGRLWIFWVRGGAIEAIRTGSDGRDYGGLATYPLPKGVTSVNQLTGDATNAGLDVFASFGQGKKVGFWTRRLKPALSLTGEPGKVKQGSVINVRVGDGDPVKGASVVLDLPGKGPPLATFTDKSGRATLNIGKSAPLGEAKLHAAKDGYLNSAVKTVVVKAK